jgi:hypothetical protein
MVAGDGVDGERRVTHAQPRVAAFVAVRRRSAPVLREEQREMPPRRREVVRVHRPEDLVSLDAVVEPVDERLEEREPADRVV